MLIRYVINVINKISMPKIEYIITVRTSLKTVLCKSALTTLARPLADSAEHFDNPGTTACWFSRALWQPWHDRLLIQSSTLTTLARPLLIQSSTLTTLARPLADSAEHLIWQLWHDRTEHFDDSGTTVDYVLRLEMELHGRHSSAKCTMSTANAQRSMSTAMWSISITWLPHPGLL